MNRAALLEEFQKVEGLEELVVPKKGGTSEFVVTEDNKGKLSLKWKPSGSGRELSVGVDALAGALRHVPGMSKATIEKWPTHLLIHPLNWWFQHGDGDARALYNSLGEVVSFTKRADHGIHRPTRVLEAIEDSLNEINVPTNDLYFDKVRVSLDRVSFAVITHEKAEEIKPGDIFDAGIWTHMSPTGESFTEVSPYLNRLVCTNGMTSPVVVARHSQRGSDGDSIYEWTKNTTVQAWDAIDGELNAIRNLTEIEIDGNVHNIMADLFERHHIPVRQRESILEALGEESDGTMYGVAQAFNRAANEIEDVSALRHLLMVTGDIAHQTERCTTCMRAIN